MRSFAARKTNKQWIWLAIDVVSKKIVGVYTGSRDLEKARWLWNSLPPVYRECAVNYTDFWEAYESVFPSKRHKAVDEASGKTSYIERFNCAMRQRISRLVRERRCFSRKSLKTALEPFSTLFIIIILVWRHKEHSHLGTTKFSYC